MAVALQAVGALGAVQRLPTIVWLSHNFNKYREIQIFTISYRAHLEIKQYTNFCSVEDNFSIRKLVIIDSNSRGNFYPLPIRRIIFR